MTDGTKYDLHFILWGRHRKKTCLWWAPQLYSHQITCISDPITFQSMTIDSWLCVMIITQSCSAYFRFWTKNWCSNSPYVNAALGLLSSDILRPGWDDLTESYKRSSVYNLKESCYQAHLGASIAKNLHTASAIKVFKIAIVLSFFNCSSNLMSLFLAELNEKGTESSFWNIHTTDVSCCSWASNPPKANMCWKTRWCSIPWDRYLFGS